MQIRPALLYITLLVLLHFCTLSCTSGPKTKEASVGAFGLRAGDDTTKTVLFQLDRFGNYNALLERIADISCADSLPTLELQLAGETGRLYLLPACEDPTVAPFYRPRDALQMHNDSLIKNNQRYPIGSLPDLLRRDLENHGRDPELSTHPDKLVIWVSASDDQLQLLPERLSPFLLAYEQITGKRDIKVWMKALKPKPPPPANVEENDGERLLEAQD